MECGKEPWKEMWANQRVASENAEVSSEPLVELLGGGEAAW